MFSPLPYLQLNLYQFRNFHTNIFDAAMKVPPPVLLTLLLAICALCAKEADDFEIEDALYENEENKNQTYENEEKGTVEEKKEGVVHFQDDDEDVDPEVDEAVEENNDEIEDVSIGSCGNPPAVENARVQGSSKPPYAIGTSLSYTCEFGYTEDGASHTTHCVQPGTWTEINIICIPQSCGEPGFVANGRRLGSRFTFPNRISFECDDGYELRGNNIRYCQVNGRWSGSLPSCEKIFCDPPDDIENGRVIYSSLEYLSQLRYECNKGYLLKNHQTRVCTENGTWSGTQPLCLEAQCDPVVAPEYGSVEIVGGTPRIGSIALYSCEGGRRLIGSATSKCLAIGEWTFPTPLCAEPCNIPTLHHGHIRKYTSPRRNSRKTFVKITPGTKVEDGEVMYLRCDKNYEPLGKASDEEKVTCQNGEWLKDPVCEPAQCKSNPPATKNGRVSSVNRTHGGGVVYLCNKHFTKKQRGNVTCNFGTWKGNTPVCADSRCYLDQIKFPGLIVQRKTVYSDMEFFKPTCEEGYEVAKPDKRITCEDGTWRGHFPPCTAASCVDEPPLVRNGRVKAYSGIHSSVVTYECDEGYNLLQQSQVQCLFGEWKGTPPLCEDTSCNVSDLKMKRGIVVPEEKFVRSGNTLNVICAAGYTKLNVKPICSNGKWTEYGTSPCRENDCYVSNIENGALTTLIEVKKYLGFKTEWKYDRVRIGTAIQAGSSLYISCYPRHTFQGGNSNNIEVVCREGQWEPKPLCLLQGTPYQEKFGMKDSLLTSTEIPTTTTTEATIYCTYPGHVDLVAHDGSRLLQPGSQVAAGSTVTFYCKRFGYDKLIGPSKIVCSTGDQWHSSALPDCVPPRRGDTVVLLDPLIKILPCGVLSLEQGVEIQISCISNGISAHPAWSTNVPANIYKFDTLDYPNGQPRFSSTVVIKNASLSHSGQYQCFLPGYTPTILDIQVAVQCRKFEETEDLLIHYDMKQNINSSAIFTCKERNKKLAGSSVLTCLPNGQWSGEAPICTAIGCPKLEEKEGILITYSHELAVGSTATFHCFAPYVQKGDSNIHCLRNGQWSGSAPTCTLSTCTLESLFQHIPEGIVPLMDGVNNNTLPYGFELILTCEDNLRLAEPATAKCANEGSWEVPSVACLPGCGAVVKPPDSQLIIEPEKSFYRFGELIVLSCVPGQRLDSEVEILMCLSKGWSETDIPNCVDS